MRKFLAAAACASLLVFLVTACGGGSDSSPTGSAGSTGSEETGDGEATGGGEDSSPLVIGAAVAETGFMTAYDGGPTEALKLAIAEKNKEGGIDGRKVELKIEDTASDQAQAKSAADELLSEGAEMIVVSCDFDYGSPAAQVAQNEGKITFSLCAQSLKFGVQGIGPLAYTPAASANDEGATTAEWVLQEKGWKRGFVLEDPTTAYDQETCGGFVERFEDKGGEIVGKATFKNEDSSIASQLAQLKQAQPAPEFVRVCSYPPGAGTAVKQIRAAGIDLPIVADAAMDGTYWLEAIPNISDMYYPTPGSIYGDDPNPNVNAFVKEFDAATGSPPANAYSLFGRALFELYAQGVEAAGSTDGEAVAAAMNEFQEVPTIAGPTSYTDEIHIALDRPWFFVEVTNGKPKYVGTFKASEPAPFKIAG